MGLYFERPRRRSRFGYPRWHDLKPGETTEQLRVEAHDVLPHDALTATRQLLVGRDASFAKFGPTPALEELDLFEVQLDDPGLDEHLGALPALREVHVHTEGVLDAALAARVRRVPKLTGWYHSGEHGADVTALEALRGADQLRALHVVPLRRVFADRYALQKGHGSALTARVIEALTTTPLERLWLNETGLTPDALRAMSELRSLRDLRLRCVRSLHGPGEWSPLSELDGLETLSLFESTATPEVAGFIARLTKLRTLDIGDTEIDGPELAELTALTQLEALGVKNAQRSGEALARLTSSLPLRDLVAASVAYGPWAEGLLARGTLEHIGLTLTDVPDAMLATLGKLPRLRNVDLSSARQLTGAGVVALAQCQTIEALQLDFTPLDDSAMEALGAAPALRELDLAGVRGVSDAGLRALARSPSLQKLVVSHVDELSGETFEALGAIPSLEDLTANGCTGIGPAHVASVRAARSSLELRLDGWQIEARGLPRSARVEAVSVFGTSPFCGHNERILSWAEGGLETKSLDGAVIATASNQWSLHPDVFRANGTLVAYGGKGALVVESIDGRPLLNDTFSSQNLRSVTASRDGRRVFYVDDKRLRVRDVDPNRLLFCIDLPWEPQRVTVSLDGTVVTVSGAGVLLLRCSDATELLRRDEPALWARSFDGRTVDVVLPSRRVERWSIDDGSTLESWSPPPSEELVALSFGPGRVVLSNEALWPSVAPKVRLAGRTENGSLRVLLSGRELWDRGTSVMLDRLGGISESELTEDGLSLLVPMHEDPPGFDRYSVDALLAFVRTR